MVYDKIKEIIAEQLGVEADVISQDTNLMKDLEADSLDGIGISLCSAARSTETPATTR